MDRLIPILTHLSSHWTVPLNLFWILGTVVPFHLDFVVLLRRYYVTYLQENSHYRTVYLKSGNLFSVKDNGHSSTPFFLKQLKNMVKLVTPENFGGMSTVQWARKVYAAAAEM